MNEKTFNKLLADYLADVVHDIQNYTITIALGKESLWSLIKNYIQKTDDQNNIQNFLRIIENSNNKINDIAYLINAVRVFFDGKVNLHKESVDITEMITEVINKLNYKFSPSKYDIAFQPGQIDPGDITADKESLKYLVTILIKILKMEKQGASMTLTAVKTGSTFEMELVINGENQNFVKKSFTNSPEDFLAGDNPDDYFIKYIHFFVIDAIAKKYNGEFLVSSQENICNGFKITMNF